jgi:hypothetical protein
MITLKELKIPIWSIIVVVVAIITITILVVRYNVSVRERSDSQAVFDSVLFVNSQILKQKDDTITYLKELVVKGDEIAVKNKARIASLQARVNEISSQVDEYTTSECYGLINAKIEPIDTLVYKFSDNQVREVCEIVALADHMDTLILSYREYTFSLEASMEARDREIRALEEIKKLLSDQVKLNSEAISELERKLKRQKLLRNIAISAVPVALVVGVCL